MRNFRRALWSLRAAAKWVALKSRLVTVVESCSVCAGRVQFVWWAPDTLWMELTGAQPVAGDNMPGVLCPRCFDELAHSRGIILRWHPRVAHLRDPITGEWSDDVGDARMLTPAPTLNVFALLQRLAPNTRLKALADALWEQGLQVDMIKTEPLRSGDPQSPTQLQEYPSANETPSRTEP